MIRLSRLADYAVVVMSHFALHDRGLISTQQLSELTTLSVPTVSKILKSLVRQGLLESVRGVHGGYQLAKPATSITVAEIITAVDGPIALTDCADEHKGECGIESLCPVRDGWRRINSAIRHTLEEISLQELITPASFELGVGHVTRKDTLKHN